MNRIELRQQIKDLLAWDVQDSDQVAQEALDRSVTHGYDTLVAEAAEAFYGTVLRQRIPGSAQVPAGATVATTADPYVLTFGGTAFTPSIDRTWDGTMWIEVTASSGGRVLRFQCRSFWSTVTAGVTSYHVSLDRQWPLGAASGMAFALIAQYVWLPRSVLRLVAAMRYGSTGGPLTIRPNMQAVLLGEVRNLVSNTGGFPTEIRRERTYQQPAPNIAPEVDVVDGVWTDAEPVGSFKYLFTYCWGYRDKLDNTPGGTPVPLYESSPSPISAEAIVPDMTKVVELKLPNIEWELGFDKAGTLRRGHSGVYKRIYRARITATTGTNASIESPEVYQYIADVDGSDTSWTDNGTAIPDYTLRLPDIGGYDGWTLWPTPSEDTELDLNVIVRPPKLENDYDAVVIKPEYNHCLALLAAAWHAGGRDGDGAKAGELRETALRLIRNLRAEAANPTGIIDRLGFDRRRGGVSGPWRYKGV